MGVTPSLSGLERGEEQWGLPAACEFVRKTPRAALTFAATCAPVLKPPAIGSSVHPDELTRPA
jgi:hypothetical protein